MAAFVSMQGVVKEYKMGEVTITATDDISFDIEKGEFAVIVGSSGAGKTTQARLWEKFRLAEVVCNDRTALRRKEGVWKTYGFSIDGSAPVYRPGVWTAAAVAVLSHGENNTVQSLSGLPAVRALLKQMVIDAWNPAMRSGMADRVIGMLTGIPVYRLVCTPDRQAVECLEQQLRKDGIL